MKKFKFLILFLFFISFANATEIYYVNIYETVNKSKIKSLAETVLKQKADKLAKKLGINDLKKKKNLTQADMVKYQNFVLTVNRYQAEVSNNITKLMAKLMEKFGKKYGYQAIVAEISVLYCNKKYNKTDQFIKFVNSEIEKNKSKIIKEIGNIK